MPKSVFIAMCVLAGTLATGCGKRRPAPSLPSAPTPTEPVPPPALAHPEPPPPAPSSESEDEAFARLTLAELNAQRPLKDVHFELDSDRLDGPQLAVLDANARWLARWPTTRITVEGHCDARGTSEYNLALGERRASAVKRYLSDLGISPERVVTVTKGEEEPVCQESDEDCWRQNRRGHPVITGK
jgi:peptidoglycan-associated lipoprotein